MQADHEILSREIQLLYENIALYGNVFSTSATFGVNHLTLINQTVPVPLLSKPFTNFPRNAIMLCPFTSYLTRAHREPQAPTFYSIVNIDLCTES